MECVILYLDEVFVLNLMWSEMEFTQNIWSEMVQLSTKMKTYCVEFNLKWCLNLSYLVLHPFLFIRCIVNYLSHDFLELLNKTHAF